MVYNLSNYTSADNLLELAVAADGLAGNRLFTVFLALILIITFVAMNRFPAGKAFISSTFITFLLAAVLWVSDLVSETTIIVFFILFVGSIAVQVVVGD